MPKAAKKLPNTAGQKALQQPKFGQVSGGVKLGQGSTHGFKGLKQQFGHGDYLPDFFKRGMQIEFETSAGDKGIGKIRNRGSKGVQVLSDSGKIVNVFLNEIKGKYHPETAGVRR